MTAALDHVRNVMVEAAAKALCSHAYPGRTLDEALAPKTSLWMRLIPEAELAVDAALKAQAALASPPGAPVAQLSASEALYGFAGWLTCREQRTVMGAAENSAPIAELVGEYCKSQGLAEPRQGWNENLRPPPASPTSPPAQEEWGPWKLARQRVKNGILYAEYEREQINAVAPGERKPGEIASSGNDGENQNRSAETGQESVANPINGTPIAAAPSPDGKERPTWKATSRNRCDNCGRRLIEHEEQRFCPQLTSDEAPTPPSEKERERLGDELELQAKQLMDGHFMSSAWRRELAEHLRGYAKALRQADAPVGWVSVDEVISAIEKMMATDDAYPLAIIERIRQLAAAPRPAGSEAE